jgi:colanic acid biosynthesis glycosyl transferase WcaI
MARSARTDDGGNGRGAAPRIQLWTCYFDPEPTGIAPVAGLWARLMRARGYDVDVVAAHPHYPSPNWGRRALPYREERDGISILRLPLWVGRETTAARFRQELSFALSNFAALPGAGRPDAMVVISPSFPALLPAIANARLKKLPWALWIHDILPEGAAATGMIDEGAVLRASRWLERTAYRRADRIVVLSQAFVDNLRAKGVPAGKIELIFDPATRDPGEPVPEAPSARGPRLLSMGNIGFSQGLAPLVAAFDQSEEMRRLGARLVITGDGVAAPEVRARATRPEIEMPGIVDDSRLEQELRSAALGVVTQRHDGAEFNLPSKLMNFMAYGVPILAAVNPSSEVARLVQESGGGWVVDSSDAASFPAAAAAALADPAELDRRGRAGQDYAEKSFSQQIFAERFDRVLRDVVGERR